MTSTHDDEHIAWLTSERVEIAPYDPAWPARFEAEAEHLRTCLPADVVGRIEHFGSTAVPGLSAKPIIDVLVEVRDMGEVRERIVPILESQGYEYLWRPTFGDDGPPWYAWFIKRDPETGERTHHIHMAESSKANPEFTTHWDRVLFRDWLRAHEDDAKEYGALKERVAAACPDNRIAYTEAKTEFITRVTDEAKAAR